VVEINTLAHAEIAMIVDRGVKKIRVNIFKDGKIRGFLRPIGSFMNGEFGAGNRKDPNP
jgi:hypothetical protein